MGSGGRAGRYVIPAINIPIYKSNGLYLCVMMREDNPDLS